MQATRAHLRLQTTWLAVMDVVCLVVGAVMGVILRLGPQEVTQYGFGHLEGWVLLVVCVIAANYLAGSYRMQYTFSRFNLLVTWAFSLLFSLLIIGSISYAWFLMLLGRGVLLLTIVIYGILSLALKMLVYRSLFRSEAFLCRTVILGSGERAQEVRRKLESAYVLPAHRVVAFVEQGGGDSTELVAERFVDGVAVVMCRAAEVAEVVRCLGAGLVVICLDDLAGLSDLYAPLRRLRFSGVEVLMPQDVAEIYSGATPLDLVTEDELMRATLQSRMPVYRRVKRVVDLGVAVAGGLLLLPVIGLVGLVVWLQEPRGPVFYQQERVGQFGRRFKIVKFRTMRVDAEKETGPVWATEGDPRITPVGRFLRKSRLDELPQIWNVLCGEMSIVGPRPERPELTRQLAGEIAWYEERENVLPVITGWAQIRYPYGSSVEDARRKLEFDLFYIKHMSFSLDVQIILRTFRIVLFGKERKV